MTLRASWCISRLMSLSRERSLAQLQRKQATTTIPIVFVGVADPLLLGSLPASLALAETLQA